MDMKQKITMLLGLTAFTCGSAFAASNTVFTGIDIKDDSTYFYLGGVNALNGNLDSNGWLARGVFGYGEYDYSTTAVPGNVDVDQVSLQAGLGYQWLQNNTRLSLYLSLDYQDHDHSPEDVLNSVRDDETGGAVQAELETGNGQWHLGLIGSYSTAYDTYWTRTRVGYMVNGATVGPEVILSGNEEYDEERYGLFVSFPYSVSTSINLSGGYAETEGDKSIKDEDGGYLAIGASFRF